MDRSTLHPEDEALSLSRFARSVVAGRRFGLRCLVIVMTLAGLVLVCIAPPAGATSQTPGQLVQANSEHVMHVLEERRVEFESHPDALHRFIREEFSQSFDRLYAARLVLGDSSRTASDADVQAFADALVDHLMARYGSSLLKIHPGLRVRVVSELPLREGSIVKVLTRIDRSNGGQVSVDYLLHQNAGRWQVFDVIVEGISFVQTFRSVFADVLRSKPLPAITGDLRAGKILVGSTAIDHPLGGH
jgi:phospholipid transport system substrate-binding protein